MAKQSKALIEMRKKVRKIFPYPEYTPLVNWGRAFVATENDTENPGIQFWWWPGSSGELDGYSPEFCGNTIEDCIESAKSWFAEQSICSSCHNTGFMKISYHLKDKLYTPCFYCEIDSKKKIITKLSIENNKLTEVVRECLKLCMNKPLGHAGLCVNLLRPILKEMNGITI